MDKAFVITGLGGSGTRLIGEYFKLLRYDLGRNINPYYDNLDIFGLCPVEKVINLDPAYYEMFKSSFDSKIKISYGNRRVIVIKSPALHMFLPFLYQYFEEKNCELKMIHVIRDAAYMINSKNQNLFKLCKHLFQFEYESKFRAIEFWYFMNKRAIKLLNNLKIKHLVIFYDNFIEMPGEHLENLLKFTKDKADLGGLSNKIKNFDNFNATKMPLANIPSDLISKMEEIDMLIKQTNEMQDKDQFLSI